MLVWTGHDWNIESLPSLDQVETFSFDLLLLVFDALLEVLNTFLSSVDFV